MGPLWNFAWGPSVPPKIGELVMYFNGGTLQILLESLGNPNGGSPGPSTKMSTESPVMIEFDMLFRAVNILSYILSMWYSRYSEANSFNSGSRFLNSFWGFWHESVWFNWERTKSKIHYCDRWISWIRTSWYKLHDIFRFDNLMYGLSTRSLSKCIAFEFKHSEW